MIPQHYSEAVAVLIAGGPSLTAEQVELCRAPHGAGALRMFGCNDAYRICDFLDVLYAADWEWVDYHDERVPDGIDLWTSERAEAHQRPRWNRVQVPGGDGLSLDRTKLHSGHNSGYQLINLAFLMGCNTIILIGYDFHSPGRHWFGRHPTRGMDRQPNLGKWAQRFRTIAEQAPSINLTVLNATPGSAIDAFPRVDLKTTLEELSYADAS